MLNTTMDLRWMPEHRMNNLENVPQSLVSEKTEEVGYRHRFCSQTSLRSESFSSAL